MKRGSRHGHKLASTMAALAVIAGCGSSKSGGHAGTGGTVMGGTQAAGGTLGSGGVTAGGGVTGFGGGGAGGSRPVARTAGPA